MYKGDPLGSSIRYVHGSVLGRVGSLRCTSRDSSTDPVRLRHQLYRCCATVKEIVSRHSNVRDATFTDSLSMEIQSPRRSTLWGDLGGCHKMCENAYQKGSGYSELYTRRVDDVNHTRRGSVKLSSTCSTIDRSK